MLSLIKYPLHLQCNAIIEIVIGTKQKKRYNFLLKLADYSAIRTIIFFPLWVYKLQSHKMKSKNAGVFVIYQILKPRRTHQHGKLKDIVSLNPNPIEFISVDSSHNMAIHPCKETMWFPWTCQRQHIRDIFEKWNGFNWI